MKTFRIATMAMAALAGAGVMASCSLDDDEFDSRRPTALVTIYPTAGAFQMQLDDSTLLIPNNMSRSPYGDKQVRALVNYTEDSKRGSIRNVHVNWVDSIRTKQPVVCTTNQEASQYGSDPIDIVKDWVTVAEDGYLTLRFRTKWASTRKTHNINLVTGLNPDDPFELELHHDASGETEGSMGDALIAFDLNRLSDDNSTPKTIRLKWYSFDGPKTAEFNLRLHKEVLYTK